MNTPKKPSAALLALTASALSLPGYAPQAAAWAAPEVQVDYRYSAYREDDLLPDKTNGLSGKRYSVDSHQFQLIWPTSERMSFTADAVVETMSGASPWFIVPDANGKPIQIMSGATIEDNRAALDLHANVYQKETNETFSLGVNKERDYLSYSGGVEGAWNFDQERRTLSAGVGYSRDQLSPTDGRSTRFPNRIDSASKNTINAVAGYSQVLGQQTQGQVSVSFTSSDGYLSDPYKQAYVAANIVPDHRPDRRTGLALSARLRHYFSAVSAAVHLDYRNYGDSWGVRSNTLELAWYQTLPDDWKLVPAVRYYEQGLADFYRPYYNATRSDGFYSSDYRLSPYGALSYRLGLDKKWNNWSFALSGERYESNTKYAAGHVDPSVVNPGLVDFKVLSLSLGYRF